ncbi:MAG TPA: pyridoxamine 5'-phosphate oxidase family protein [Candidatus Bathyarchaeia archaeon]|nr:pyridoxamine 5'-phosphate oxidase family protein [Candidatus Bathyarchaeia archaeon]
MNQLFNRPEEEFLEKNEFARICTVDPDGYPHCVRVEFVYDKGRLFIGSQSARIWHRHLSTNPKVAFETDRWEQMENRVFDYRGLLIKGEAQEIEDAVTKEEAMKLLREKEPGAPFGEHPIVIRIIPKKRYKWGPWMKVVNDPLQGT